MVLGNRQLEETLSVLKEITAVFQSDEDPKLIKSCLKQQSEIVSIGEKKLSESREVIEDLSVRVLRAEENATRKESEEEHKKRVAALDAEKQALIRSIDEYENQIKKAEKAIEGLKEERDDILKQQKAVEEDRAAQVPRVKDALSLYATISGIRWDYESDLVKGYVSIQSEKKDIKPFKLDPKKSSAFEIANHLWDMME